MESKYDFVVVGGGPAGSAVAAGLAAAAKKPTVLLLEAGGPNSDREMLVDGKRWVTLQQESMNWSYKTTPQEHCANRELDYSRGLGLGGSSAINFGVFTRGARDDYEEWARIVGDDNFRWEPIWARFKRLETFHGELPPTIDKKYAAPKAEDHGSAGPLHVGYAAEWETDLPPLMDLFEEAGFSVNPDHNSGNPLGMSILINSSSKGLRSTAKDLLTPIPENLTIITDSPVQRVILEGKKAIGVESNGNKYTPAIGQGLRDHMFSPLVYTRAEGSTARGTFYGSQAAMDIALAQWRADGTGPWSKFACELGIGFFKLASLAETPEFRALPAAERAYLEAPTVPHYEILTHFPMHWFLPGGEELSAADLNSSCLLVFYYNAQARGEVTLQSADPATPLRFDPRFLSTAFDRRVAIDAMREALQFARREAYARDSVALLAGPGGDSDHEILDYWRRTIASSWHMTGTVKMGRPGDEDAAVDSAFRVTGFEGLRVADMSVVPVLASCHVQAVAYVTGMTCAEKLVREYGLA
ncbi:Uu.00g088360.m01.CDS01 [Anthostomella pinea]|uniref:Uu.00g088360.m01.CDS01 n=1 Tax=Anthostomella pinea TaxID=933095 RepID=A0AAI8YK26_9PEZI|nr:Uu.00g088360.m01.CDS01 [Anthostomella pinea]